jgi:hypothetical protein
VFSKFSFLYLFQWLRVGFAILKKKPRKKQEMTTGICFFKLNNVSVLWQIMFADNASLSQSFLSLLGGFKMASRPDEGNLTNIMQVKGGM